MKSSTIPGIFMPEMDSFQIFHEDPPPGCEIDHDKFDDPFPGKTIYDIGINNLAKDLDLCMNNNSELGVNLYGAYAKQLNKNQGYFILCNIFHKINEFVGEKLDGNLKYKVKEATINVLKFLAQRETNPGNFGQTVDPKDRLYASDFGLKDYE